MHGPGTEDSIPPTDPGRLYTSEIGPLVRILDGGQSGDPVLVDNAIHFMKKLCAGTHDLEAARTLVRTFASAARINAQKEPKFALACLEAVETLQSKPGGPNNISTDRITEIRSMIPEMSTHPHKHEGEDLLDQSLGYILH